MQNTPTTIYVPGLDTSRRDEKGDVLFQLGQPIMQLMELEVDKERYEAWLKLINKRRVRKRRARRSRS
ncbi:MAG: hypothetical protein A3H57_02205 [Candidatus Taylorbacteria bacterium RIFCSPLOWO2_02_FULL_43_11]|uniref:Uncharacterized protein n=1 Tax=Candidatus Taylorbacteria bacterium RIFCSPHIGHO2_02_FULL_43_32b TaxID=1802306 RepID=A0A1G2MFU4_9BACT|nr:MAG: hypothetical protein A2743_02335 [Candidatus Taylorbacteria bacterium RIFCSPHIGHO2_01_FULL_43_47]OHA22019.1 MAG: hypothetical protein A3C72_01995 [Candidatus Taylorbacteria bacterium RIFCSPHIGHO2_02_FULL_43_32b]OHA28759.1 MAG: hypothetical protein A3B08_01170 [Candidatus Taylorbacteria bacterium RIFCSPLOWO2_01_FULL_43_44]OHA35490.1 MAG: hypothetical protein A3H57_02205 [Candidatus Taylorbacteria bacterium RIFCSPLOWO2_02_FULL_43_11]